MRGHLWCLLGLFMAVAWSPVTADFNCLCNYAVERAVYASPDTSSTKLGYMYEFDCKSIESSPGLAATYKAIAFEHQLGFVELDSNAELQICSGEISKADIITSTLSTIKPTIPAVTTTTSVPTTTTSTAATTQTTTTLSTTVPTTTTTQRTTTTTPITTTTTPTTTPITTTTTMGTTTSTTPTPTTTTTVTTTTTRPTTTTPKPTPPPITWPYGTYTLIEPATKCPGTFWKFGFRRFDTEDTGSNNYFRPTGHIQYYLAGSFRSDDITLGFCTKLQAVTDTGPQRDWQPGNYCILKKGTCPRGFHVGSIFWDDDDLGNHNGIGGVLPDGEYGKNTKIYFCCRSDGIVYIPLDLPRESPFILLRYRSSCQTVRGMHVREIVVRWDDEDLFNKDTVSGAHPYDDGGSDDHRLHFCHYHDAQTPSIIG